MCKKKRSRDEGTRQSGKRRIRHSAALNADVLGGAVSEVIICDARSLSGSENGRQANLQLTVPIEVPLVKKVLPSVLLDQAILRSSDDGGESEGQGEDRV